MLIMALMVGQASTSCPNPDLSVVIAGGSAPDGTALGFLGSSVIEVVEIAGSNPKQVDQSSTPVRHACANDAPLTL